MVMLKILVQKRLNFKTQSIFVNEKWRNFQIAKTQWNSSNRFRHMKIV